MKTCAIVQVEDVFVAFPGAAGTVMALRGADLTVAVGERLLVQGPNGSGKSTLLRVITGEQPVVAGSVEVDGAPLLGMNRAQGRRWRARAVGFLDQQSRRSLLSEQSVLDNVALQLRLVGVGATEARARALVTLDAYGLRDLAERSVPDLSGGEAQQVAICAAVAHEPRLVLADEPTGELDERAAGAVHEMLSRIAARGTSIILVSHDPRSTAFADRAVQIRDGRVAEQWTSGSGEVEQVPDRCGWVRVPPELLTTPSAGLVATSGVEGVLLRPSSKAREDHAEMLRTASPSSGAFRLSASGIRAGAPAAEGPAAEGRAAEGAPAGSPMVLELDGVVAGYPGRPVFAGLDLRLDRGELMAVTGESGTGKSTLLSLAGGLVDPTAGTVRIGQRSWLGLDRSARAALRRVWVAAVPQRPSVVESLTVRENLRLTVSVRGISLSEEEVVDTADRLGLTALLDQAVHLMSGGERQRVALARCLVSGAPLLLLDEPTSQQDEASAARVIAVLQEEADAGRAVLSASHDPRLTERAHRTLRLGPPNRTPVEGGS